MFLFHQQGESLHTTADTLNITLPAGVLAGDFALLTVACKYPPVVPTGPSGWTQIATRTRENGTPGVGSGPLTAAVFARTMDGSESGSTIQVGATDSNMLAVALDIFRARAGARIAYAVTSGVQEAGSLDWSVTFDADPGLERDDFCWIESVTTSTGGFRSSEALSAPGATFGAFASTLGEIRDGGWSSGDDLGVWTVLIPVASGPSSGAATYVSRATTNAAGVCFLVRLRTAPDTTAPTVAIVSPTAGTAIAATTPLVIDVTDVVPGVLRALLWVRIGDGEDWLAAYDGTGFVGSFADSTIAAITNGFRVTLRRAGGWRGAPSLRVKAIDIDANIVE